MNSSVNDKLNGVNCPKHDLSLTCSEEGSPVLDLLIRRDRPTPGQENQAAQTHAWPGGLLAKTPKSVFYILGRHKKQQVVMCPLFHVHFSITFNAHFSPPLKLPTI